MRWTIEGADKQTGRERVLGVDANTRAEAVEYAIGQGLLVADVHESIINTVLPEVVQPKAASESVEPDPLPAPELAAPPVEAAPVHYPTPERVTPAYAGLRVGGTMLFWLAILFYLISFSLGCVFAWLAAVHWPDVMNQRLTFLGASLAAALIAGLLHAASSACNALRDIARDLLRDVTRVVVATSVREASPNSSTIEGAGA